ncbi:MAG: fumarylacetoacetase [Gemmatimonadota bacterium]|nr:fumarylacetoacetase [Gemmatimonadota bacterium]
MTNHAPDDIDETHNADLVSWVESAQSADTDFPIQNLPLGVFRTKEQSPRPGVAIGDRILNLVAAAEQGMLTPALADVMQQCKADASLNPLLAAGHARLREVRALSSAILSRNSELGARAQKLVNALTVAICDAELLLPARVGDYTDFYASISHATNVGSMFRPDNPLLPNYKWVPIGYHGRASSVVPSGSGIRRPKGQIKDDGVDAPVFAATRRLDYELEVGAFVSAANTRGQPVPIAEAETHIAGLCLVNDWSARDIQAWEYQPLGPFLAKNFATTVSPWIVTLDALAPFRTASFVRPPGDPAPLPYLASERDSHAGGFDITLEVLVASARMRDTQIPAMRVSLGSFTSMYWTMAQLLTHHTSNGCNLQPGDLFASGTVSGQAKDSRGCLLERTWRGAEPLTLPTGEQRKFLEDGDEVIMRGWCEREGYRRIGFGECRGTVSAAS